VIVYTSGTTGMPKGAVLQQRALLWNGYNAIHAHDLRQDDHVLTALPLFHVGGLNNFADRLARFKHPRRVVFVEQLPKNALGKVQKSELRKLL
jgi:acyl-coenzyme A synthetase/AMP-(fatty) acid ligase